MMGSIKGMTAAHTETSTIEESVCPARFTPTPPHSGQSQTSCVECGVAVLYRNCPTRTGKKESRRTILKKSFLPLKLQYSPLTLKADFHSVP